MAEAVNQVHHEFWHPPLLSSENVIKLERSRACADCGTEFIVSSVYCHSCGLKRPSLAAAEELKIPGMMAFTALAGQLGLSRMATAAFLLGALCLLAALSVGVLFTAKTPLDSQAIQMSRIEWLLGALAAFVGGCLLKE